MLRSTLSLNVFLLLFSFFKFKMQVMAKVCLLWFIWKVTQELICKRSSRPHTVKTETLYTRERGLGTSQAATQERDKPPTLRSQVSVVVPASAAQEREKLHAPQAQVPAAGAAACERDKPSALQSQVPAADLHLWPRRVTICMPHCPGDLRS